MNRAAGPFEIIEILGEGSFGTVCVARVTGDPLRRKVALKILKGTYARNQKILNRTRDEARLLSRISHPNIVRVERLMDVGGRPVVVMEHVQGVSPDQLLMRFKEGLPGSVGIEIIRQTSLALHVAYNETAGDDGRPLRVIHRDIKPSNVILSIHGEVKVCDFGIAKGEFDGREAHTESVVMGSRPYMAPERLDGVSDSPAVDVYSAGMSLFELLTGRTMSLSINPVTHEQAMNRQLRYIRIEGMHDTAMEDLRDLLRRMCAYDRDYRPTALEAARQLEQCLYAIDSRYRVSLEEFARTTVIPIYESRPRITPEDAVQRNSEDDFLREVTGHLTVTGATGATAALAWTPYAFVGLLALVVAVLGALATYKVVNQQDATPAAYEVSDSGKVRVKVWLPSDGQAQVGGQFLPTPGHVLTYPGTTLMEIYFDNGSVLNCTFQAAEGIAVRYVVENGVGSLSVDDGLAQPCIQAAGPRKEEGGSMDGEKGG
ncbi:MAG: serine/threonine protein kinase [Deltaproteobacteria bacterium]|nr:serine/threonine protein kinase [Deltaproteobacteria bacterium]MBW2255168.1 serine/threonine protein kinase [Deltaproteobacteria bacterium]